METRSNHVLVGSVVLILLAATMLAAFWFSRISDGQDALYDIYFKQSVNGLAKGSGVTFAGVPTGQVKEIELWKRDPSFVRVRIAPRALAPARAWLDEVEAMWGEQLAAFKAFAEAASAARRRTPHHER